MMFGFELVSFAAFLKQLGLALAGACGIWGAVFAYRSEQADEQTAGVIDGWIASKLFYLLYGGILTAAIGWVWQLSLYDLYVFAHEGITIKEEADQVIAALDTLTPLFWLWILVSLLGLVFVRCCKDMWVEYLKEFYIVQFLFAGALISFPALTGQINAVQFFFFGHSFHSILTVGTVLVLDLLFLISKPTDILKQHIYPIMPTLSKVIWIGLGIEFISTWVVFEQAIAVTDKFLFMQTVIGILIINGVLLAGPVLRRLLHSIERDGHALQWRWQRIADVAGAISITSWMSITFVDFFDNLTFTYGEYIAIYVGIIAVLSLGHWIFEKIDPFARPEPIHG